MPLFYILVVIRLVHHDVLVHCRAPGGNACGVPCRHRSRPRETSRFERMKRLVPRKRWRTRQCGVGWLKTLGETHSLRLKRAVDGGFVYQTWWFSIVILIYTCTCIMLYSCPEGKYQWYRWCFFKPRNRDILLGLTSKQYQTMGYHWKIVGYWDIND